MPAYKTPGVFIEEIATLPASIAGVATAIPAFVGYTEKSEENGETIPANTPVRITSLLEYEEIFGNPFDEDFAVTLTPNATDSDLTDIAVSGLDSPSPYLLYYHLQMYFNNGGGPCYAVSVGNYADNPADSDIDVSELEAGINTLKEEDEPTLLLVPEAVQLSNADRKTINDVLLAQCNELKDRFAVMDALADPASNTVADDAAAFRGEVGLGNLKYGAAYYPSLKTNLNRYYTEGSVIITDNRPTAGSGPYHLCPLDLLSEGADHAIGKVIINDETNLVGDVFEIDGVTFEAISAEGDSVSADHGFVIGGGTATTAGNLKESIEAAGGTGYTVEKPAGSVMLIKATQSGVAGELSFTYTDNNGAGGATITGEGKLELIEPDKTLYNRIRERLEQQVTLYPSGAMAGIYARVDRQRGVWKAPANVDLRGAVPGVSISDAEQALLNVDATSGKSINAIREFIGKGTLVWGARTLAGNDNEWRYIPVRRLFIFVEESVKKATGFVVFEPNDAKTWLRVKTMIENFLSKIWRDGALAGAKPEDAYFVKVGLGETMSSLDILEGRMNIEIGMAAVRPAEFIILKFSHKLQQ